MLFAGKIECYGFHKARTDCIMLGKPESLQVRKSPFKYYMRYFLSDPGRVSVTASGSLTIETAIVLPMVLFFLLTFFSLFSMTRTQLQVQAAVERALTEGVKRTIYQVGAPLTEELWNRWLLELQVRQELEGIEGLHALNFEGSTVDLSTGTAEVKLQYEMSVDAGFFFVDNLTFQQYGIRKLWTGVDLSGIKLPETTWVYVTEHGTVYHRSDRCTHLRLSVRDVLREKVSEIRNASGGCYYACEQCRPKGADVVYVTTYGERYHGTLDCGALKRQIKTIALDQVEGLDPCSKCCGLRR